VSSNKADIDLEKHLALLSLMLVMFIQEALWFATKDDVHLVLLTLEAAVASIMLRLLFRKLDPNLPALPLHHFVSIAPITPHRRFSCYSISKTYLSSASAILYKYCGESY